MPIPSEGAAVEVVCGGDVVQLGVQSGLWLGKGSCLVGVGGCFEIARVSSLDGEAV